jgi:hypothetical protein
VNEINSTQGLLSKAKAFTGSPNVKDTRCIVDCFYYEPKPSCTNPQTIRISSYLFVFMNVTIAGAGLLALQRPDCLGFVYSLFFMTKLIKAVHKVFICIPLLTKILYFKNLTFPEVHQ